MGLLVFIKNILIMNKSQRIYLSSGDTGNDNQDKYITVKLEQDTETLEFMSLSLGTTDVYQNFNADYGVLVGRVIANGGIGIPNAKISIFIPISDEDTVNSEIYSIYPYTTPRDENNEGKRYNLLPRVSQINPETQQLEPKQAFGSFPIKEEVVGNPPFLEVYKKYYKYTALTNIAGDYMIFGVPVGTQTVHLSVDITDIGKHSMNPASMVTNLGYPDSQFIDNNTRIKPSDDLRDLPNIETQEITVDIKSFWGDAENFEIGIVRQDFRIRATLVNTFVLFGSAFTDSADTLRGHYHDGETINAEEIRDYFRVYPNKNANENRNSYQPIGMGSKRIGIITEKIYTYPPEITDAEIDAGTADPSDMILLIEGEYTTQKRNGDFILIVNCNRNKILTNDFGEEVPTNWDNPNGVFTEFRGFVTLEYTDQDLPMIGRSNFKNDDSEILPYRVRLKFPQHAPSGQGFKFDGSYGDDWRKQSAKFETGKYYSFSRFHGCTHNNIEKDKDNFSLQTGPFFRHESDSQGENINWGSKDSKMNVGVLLTRDYSGTYNSWAEFPVNVSTNRFAANWMNFSIYFPQLGYMANANGARRVKGVQTADYFHHQDEDEDTDNRYFLFDNSMEIAGGYPNTKWFGRSDLHWTDIVEVPLDDIITINNYKTSKGFTSSQISGLNFTNYRNGQNTPNTVTTGWTVGCPYNGGKVGGTPTAGYDSTYYFYKGFDTSDCFEYLQILGLVT